MQLFEDFERASSRPFAYSEAPMKRIQIALIIPVLIGNVFQIALTAAEFWGLFWEQ